MPLSALQHNKPLYSFEDNADYVYDVMWSPVHPALFACVDGMGRLDLWNLNNDTEVRRRGGAGKARAGGRRARPEPCQGTPGRPPAGAPGAPPGRGKAGVGRRPAARQGGRAREGRGG